MLELKRNITEIKNTIDRVISILHTAEKESVSSRISNQKPQKVKGKEKKDLKINRVIKNCGTTAKGTTCLMGLSEEKKREKGTGEIFETVMTGNFSKLIIDTKP